MTDQITIPRALLEQAREALEYHTQQTRPIQKTEHAILVLRTELAKPSAPAQHDAPEVAALKAELDAAMKDAERLDYLQKHARCDPKMDGKHVWWPTTFNQAQNLRGETLREAIDAAIDKAEGGKE